MLSEEAQALCRAEFWDERYAKADGDKPTHEWLRAFGVLEQFFAKYLFATQKAEAQPRILHLGSGDSVSVFLVYILKVTLSYALFHSIHHKIGDHTFLGLCPLIGNRYIMLFPSDIRAFLPRICTTVLHHFRLSNHRLISLPFTSFPVLQMLAL